MAVLTKYRKVSISRIRSSEPVFFLRDQDMLAEAAIEMYRILAVSHGSKLAEYTSIPLEKIFTIVGSLPDSKVGNDGLKDFPEFRQYTHLKYADELDDELITMIEDLIERRRRQRYEFQKQRA